MKCNLQNQRNMVSEYEKYNKKEKEKICHKKKENFRPAVGFVAVKWQPKHIDAQLTQN